MKKRRFTWKAFLMIFASVILAFGLVGCNGESTPPAAEPPTTEGTTSEHSEHPEAGDTTSEHPEHPK